jgi:hypothetical protein
VLPELPDVVEPIPGALPLVPAVPLVPSLPPVMPLLLPLMPLVPVALLGSEPDEALPLPFEPDDPAAPLEPALPPLMLLPELPAPLASVAPLAEEPPLVDAPPAAPAEPDDCCLSDLFFALFFFDLVLSSVPLDPSDMLSPAPEVPDAAPWDPVVEFVPPVDDPDCIPAPDEEPVPPVACAMTIASPDCLPDTGLFCATEIPAVASRETNSVNETFFMLVSKDGCVWLKWTLAKGFC